MTRSTLYDSKAVKTALISYTMWGLFPLYWKLLRPLSASEIFAHRIIWSFFFYGLFFIAINPKKSWHRFLSVKKPFGLLVAAAFLISMNWITYIYAVNTGHVLQGSLAYFITPLLNIALGTFVFKENLSPQLKLAILLASIGVFIITYAMGVLPWLALIMAFTFSIYGMVKKMLKIEASLGSLLETGIIFLPAFFLAMHERTISTDALTSWQLFLFIASGIVTGLPLVWFADAAQKLPYSLMGVFQFISPTLQFLLAIFLYHESFTNLHAIAFVFIWTGIFFYIREFFKR